MGRPSSFFDYQGTRVRLPKKKGVSVLLLEGELARHDMG